MAFKLFGGGAKKATTPHGALENIISSVTGGNIEKILDIFNVGDKYKSKFDGLPGVIRGYLGTYGRKLFKQSAFDVGEVKMQGENEALVTVSGKTLDGEKTAADLLEALSTKGKEMGLFDGKKDIRMAGKALGMVDDVLKKMQIGPFKNEVRMVKTGGEWKAKDTDDLSQIFARVKGSKLVPELIEKVKKIAGED